MKTFTIKKTWEDFPAAHRQPFHDGHCAHIHGHNWGITVRLSAPKLDANGFVFDFGKFKPFKKWLDHMFDHTLLLQYNDPQLVHIQNSVGAFSDIRIVDSVSCEGIAKWVFEYAQQEPWGDMLVSVTVTEDSKNAATYE